MGADLAFDTKQQPLTDTVRGYMPEGVDLYIDAVGNPNLLMDGMRLIRQEGTIGLYGLGLRADAAIDWSLLPHNCILQTVQWPIAAQESAVHDEVCGYVTSGRLPLRERLQAAFFVQLLLQRADVRRVSGVIVVQLLTECVIFFSKLRLFPVVHSAPSECQRDLDTFSAADEP